MQIESVLLNQPVAQSEMCAGILIFQSFCQDETEREVVDDVLFDSIL